MYVSLFIFFIYAFCFLVFINRKKICKMQAESSYEIKDPGDDVSVYTSTVSLSSSTTSAAAESSFNLSTKLSFSIDSILSTPCATSSSALHTGAHIDTWTDANPAVVLAVGVDKRLLPQSYVKRQTEVHMSATGNVSRQIRLTSSQKRHLIDTQFYCSSSNIVGNHWGINASLVNNDPANAHYKDHRDINDKEILVNKIHAAPNFTTEGSNNVSEYKHNSSPFEFTDGFNTDRLYIAATSMASHKYATSAAQQYQHYNTVCSSSSVLFDSKSRFGKCDVDTSQALNYG